MTEQERSLYYTDKGIRKKLPTKENLPYMISVVLLFLNIVVLYRIVSNISHLIINFIDSLLYNNDDIILINGIFTGIITLVFCLVFFRMFFKKCRCIKSTTYSATYENSHDPEGWKTVYRKNWKFVSTHALIFLLLVVIGCLTEILI